MQNWKNYHANLQFMNLKNKIVVLLMPFLMLACASNQKKQPEIKEIFVTDIKENGLKLFSYSVTMSSPQKETNGNGRGRKGAGGMGGGMRGRNGGGSPNHESMTNRSKAKINEKLDSKLAETGYCREGYIVLNSYAGKGKSQIRGECKEGATDSDRKKFSNAESI